MPKLNFTINVSLKSFFADNRTRAKLFIDENIKNISNLEEKITRIFGIKHFYLLNNGQLLPSCEDIRILDKDAVIRVVPNNFLPPKLLLDDEYYVIDDDIVNNKNKKRKNTESQCPVKEKKCKRKKKVHSSDDEIMQEVEVKKIAKVANISSVINNSKKEMKTANSDVHIFKELKPFASTPKELQNKTCHGSFRFNKKQKEKNSELVNEDEKRKRKITDSCKYTNNEEGSDSQNMEVDNISDIYNQQEKVQNSKRKLELKVVSKDCSNTNNIELRTEEPQSTDISTSQKKLEVVAKKISSDCSSSGDSDSKECRQGKTSHMNKKKKFVSWSTSPLLKTTNHVEIKKIPIEALNVDFSKFVFSPYDAGIIPIPEVKEIGELDEISTKNILTCIAGKNDTKQSSIQETILSNETNNQIRDIPVSESDCDEMKCTLDNRKTFADSAIVPVLENENFLASKCMSENGKDREKLNSSLQKKNVLNSWKQNVLNKLSNNCQNESNEQSKVSDTNTAAEKSIDLTSATPKMKQLNPKSIAIKKQNSLDHGVAYYFKLMDKIGWDMSKSISSVSLEETSTSETIETQKASEPKKEVIDVNNDFEYSDSNSVSESNYITRRKRKRKHKRKPRVPTPIPGKLLNNNLCQRKLPIVPGTPKVHIRFDNEQKTLSSVNNNPKTPKTIEEQEETSEPKETIKILQNVSITSSKIDSSIQGSQEDISTSNVPDIQITELPHECSDTLYIKTELKNQTPETYSGDVQSTQTNTLDHTSENVNQLAYGDESSLFKSHFMNSNLSDDSLKFAKLSLLKELLNSKCAEDKSTINITIDSDDSFRNTKS